MKASTPWEPLQGEERYLAFFYDKHFSCVSLDDELEN